MNKNKTILVKVDYSDNSGKFWRDSYIKNITVSQLDKETIHDTIKRVIENTDGLKLTHGGKPQSNMYRDVADNSKIVGYVYRAKDEIDGKRALFNVWVEMREVLDLELKDIENN